MNIILLLIYVLLSSFGLVLFKLGAAGSGFEFSFFGHAFNFTWQAILGIIFYGCSFLLWLYIVSKNDLTFIFPLQVALVNFSVVALSIIFLDERVSILQGIGIIVIIVGIILMRWGSN